MNKHFLRVRFNLPSGQTSYGYICLNDIISYREHAHDCTETVIETAHDRQVILLRCQDLNRIMQKYFTIIDDTNGNAS